MAGSNEPRVKMGQGSRSATVAPLPERVELTVNSRKETNGRVKMGNESRWATVVYPLKESNNSEQQDRNKWKSQIGPKSQNGPIVKMGQ